MNHKEREKREQEKKDEMPKRGSRATYEAQWEERMAQKRERLIQSIGTKASIGGPICRRSDIVTCAFWTTCKTPVRLKPGLTWGSRSDAQRWRSRGGFAGDFYPPGLHLYCSELHGPEGILHKRAMQLAKGDWWREALCSAVLCTGA